MKEWFFVHSSKMYESEVEKSCVKAGGGWWELGEPTHIHIWCRILPDWRRHTVREYLLMEFLYFKKGEVGDLIPIPKKKFSISRSKGQLISKGHFGIFSILPKKRKKNFCPNRPGQVRFLGELETPKRHFEINWPLLPRFIAFFLIKSNQPSF